MELSVILPCFNEEKNAEPAVRDVAFWLSKKNIDGEIIVVDDGSSDGTAAKLASLSREFSNLRVVTHERNQGYGLAVRSGCDAATKPIIAFMDADGQFRAEDFDKLLPHLSEYSFVYGRRRHRADSFLRSLFGKVLGLFVFLIFGLWVRDVNCGMKVFTADLWKKIRPVHGVEKLFNTELFLRMKRQGIPWKQVDVRHFPRRFGTPTGGSVRVILRMFVEVWTLRMAKEEVRRARG